MIYGNIFIINNQKIFYIEKISSPEAQNQHTGEVSWQPGQDKQYDVIGILHCHLPEFTKQIHAAFSGTGDFRMALANAFEGEIGDSPYTNYLTGVVTFTTQGMQIGIYHFNQERGETYFGNQAIPGQLEKLPGVFFADDEGPNTANAIYFHQTPVLPRFNPHQPIGYTHKVATADANGDYQLTADWGGETSTHPNIASRTYSNQNPLPAERATASQADHNNPNPPLTPPFPDPSLLSHRKPSGFTVPSRPKPRDPQA